jgi:hypothetical protein
MIPISKAVAKAKTQAERNLLVASLVARLFRQAGWEIVVVGGSALEFYTDGDYVTQDVDLFRAIGTTPIPPIVEAGVMRKAGAVPLGVRRQWLLEGVTIDLFGEAETAGKAPFRILNAPYGKIKIMPAEEILVERTFMAYANNASRPDLENLNAARKLALAGLNGSLEFDWRAAGVIANSKDYRIGRRLARLKGDVAKTLKRTEKSPAKK